MNKFYFTLSTGQVFEVVGPTGSTQAQAEEIFRSKLSTGALVGLQPGDELTTNNTNLGYFSLSRLDRGTAGVPGTPTVVRFTDASVSQFGGLIANAGKYNPSTATRWARGTTPDDLTTDLNQLAKNSQYAVNYTKYKLSDLASGIVPGAAYSNTTNRQTLDAAVGRLLGDEKIPVPEFGPNTATDAKTPSVVSTTNNRLINGRNATSAAGSTTGINGISNTRSTVGRNTTPLAKINDTLVKTNLPVLGNVQVNNGIDTASFSINRRNQMTIGPLSATQVQGITAQIASTVNQDYNAASQEKGIGKYGFTCQQLEDAGYIKPGTSQSLLGQNKSDLVQPNPADFLAVLSDPSVWTSKDGIRCLDKLLAAPTVQDVIQTQLLDQSYNTLVETGEIQVAPPPAVTPVAEVYVAPTPAETTTPATSGGSGDRFGGGGCPAPEMKILLDDRSEIFAGDIKPGMLVWTRHEITNEMGAYTVAKVEFMHDQRWIVKFADGREFIGTYNHRMLTPAGWMQIDNMTENQVVLGEPNGVVVSSTPLDFGPVVKIMIDDAHTYICQGLFNHNVKLIELDVAFLLK